MKRKWQSVFISDILSVFVDTRDPEPWVSVSVQMTRKKALALQKMESWKTISPPPSPPPPNKVLKGLFSMKE